MSHGQFIRKRGSDILKDMVVLAEGQRVGAAEIGLMASVGCVNQIKI